MMMRNLVNMLLLVSVVSAFRPLQPRPAATTSLAMFNAADNNNKPAAKPLEEVSPLNEQPDITTAMASSATESKNVVRDMNTGEIKEVAWNDPYMQANTSFELGWANAFLIFPAIILLNDFLHFLPSGAPFTKY